MQIPSWLWLVPTFALGIVGQVTPADLPQCALACWASQTPTNSSSPSCTYAPGFDFEGTYSPCFYDHCTPKEALTALNITSIICDVPVRDISLGMRIFVVIAMFFSSLIVGARMILKLRSLAGEVGWDDWSIMIAVIVVTDAAIGQYLSAHYGLGRDAWKVPFEDLEKAFKSFYASTVGYKLGNMFTRMSVLCLYLRIFGHDTWFRYANYAIIVLNIIVGVSFTIIDLLQCQPVSYVWNGWAAEYEGWCLSISVITWVHSILNVILDVVTLALAVWMVRGLNMNLKKKITVIGMFVLGSAVTIVTFLRLQALPPLQNTRNRTWALAPLAYWSGIEILAGFTLACLPALKKLRYMFRPKDQITYNSSSSGTLPGSLGRLSASRSKTPIRGLLSSDRPNRNSKSYITISTSATDFNSNRTELSEFAKDKA